MKRTLAVFAAALLLAGCSKNVPAQDTGSDDERLDRYSAKLEELRARVQAHPPKCDEWCSLAREVCDLSRNTCDIAKRKLDRGDVQERCVASQEDCANFNDRCASCRG